MTDRSGTAGVASAVLMAANKDRRWLFIQNLSAGDIYINFTSAATIGGGSIKLASGGSPFFFEGSFISTEAVNVIGTGAGLSYTAKEA